MNNEIISVVILSYNSAKTILETLESIQNQTINLKKIQLIISDDASIDDTLKIAENWVTTYGKLFFSTLIVRKNKNSGVSANCNRAISNCIGDWIKLIAADDKLLPECIKKNLAYAKDTNSKIIFSKMVPFDLSGLHNCTYPPLKQMEIFNSNSLQEQLRKLRKHGGMRCAPTSFIHKDEIKKMGKLDEKNTLIEDYPMWLTLSKYYKFHFLNAITIHYRVNESISNSNSKLCNVGYIEQKKKIDLEQYKLENNWIIKCFIKSRLHDYNTLILCAKYLGNNRRPLNLLILNILSKLSLSKIICRILI